MRRLIVGAVTAAAIASAAACGSDGTSTSTNVSTGNATDGAVDAGTQAKYAKIYDAWADGFAEFTAPDVTAPCATHDQIGVYECNKVMAWWWYAFDKIRLSLIDMPDYGSWQPVYDAFSAANSMWTTNTCDDANVYADPNVAAQCDSAIAAGFVAIKDFEAALKKAAGK